MRSFWLDTHDPARIPTAELPVGISYDVAIASPVSPAPGSG